MGSIPETVVRRSAAEAVLRGHPWVFRTAVARGLERVSAGDEVQVVGEDVAALGRAIADPGSPLALRVWTSGREPIDDARVDARLARAFAVRDQLFPASAEEPTTAYRLLHGEGDRCPAFVVDRYGDAAVLRLDGAAAQARAERFAAVLWPRLTAMGIRSLLQRVPGDRGHATPITLRGAPAPAIVHVAEHGVPFAVDLARGQKTGAFLDQRENRRRVGQLARGRRVLNLFSYAGGFSVFAARGGATHVTSVDVAAQAHATAQTSFRLAGEDPAAHAFVSADVFAFLEGARKKGQRWDLVISDPPSFAANEKAKPRALGAYRALHRACVDVLESDGIFCAASCSSHVDSEDFASTLDDLALGPRGRDLRLLETYGAPADHPTLPAWPEGRYLKFFVLA
jgi:23S rRNA (cytosine1962-C5)-methyltransferase